MTASKIWVIAKRELKSYFDSPTAYVLLVVWSALLSYFFFRAVFLTNEASVRPLFELLPWFLLFFVPAVTMRALAAEKQDGTLEMLLSHPVDEIELVIGKLVANALFVLIALALTLTIPLGLMLGGRLDIGMVVGQYIGAGFLVMALTSVGLFASSLTRNQTTAFIAALTITFVLTVTGLEFVLMAVPFPVAEAARQISSLAHFRSMMRGVITLGDIVYFIALTGIFVVLSYFGLKRERESRSSARYKNLRLGSALIVIVAVLGSLIGTIIGGRLDLTSGHFYTLSDSTVKILRELPDNVTIDLYASRQLPPEAQATLRDVKDMITDYQSAGKGKVKAVFKSLGDSQEAQSQVREVGVQLVQFNVVRQDEYQVKQGYLGLTIEYRNKREVIPFVGRTEDLEYQLSRLIRKLTATKRSKVAFLSGLESTQSMSHAGVGQNSDGYTGWKRALSDEYEVTDLKLEKGQKVPDDIDSVIIAGPRKNAKKQELKALDDFLRRGGSILALIDSLDVNAQMLSVTPIHNNFIEFLTKYGFTVEPKLLYDVQANQTINGGGQQNYFSMPYPFWMRVGAGSKNNMIVKDIRSVVIPWGNPIRVDSRGGKFEPLLVTSQYGGVQEKNFQIAPDPNMSVDRRHLSTFIVAAARKFQGGGRLIVVGDSDFAKDSYVSAPDSQNGLFAINSVDWLTQDAVLTEIRSKNNQAGLLTFPSKGVKDFVRYLNLIAIPLLIIAFGIWRLNRRRRLTRREYAA